MYYGREEDFDTAEMSIDIVNDGAVSTGDVYPQPQKTSVLYNAYLIKLKNRKVTSQALLYLSCVIQKAIKLQFSYQNKATWEKVKECLISLPINMQQEIDFNYMSNCIRELKDERLNELEAYLQEAGFGDCILTKKEAKALHVIRERGIKTKRFKIDELFNIATGRDIIIGNTKEGRIPLISHQHDNNGISKRISEIANRRLFNYASTISLADRGVFLATTQAEDFYIGTRVKGLSFKNGMQSENIRLFFVSAINKLQILFSDYLTNATDNLPNLEISLPINSKGCIDYAFMETYISAIKKQCIAKLKLEIDRERAAFDKVMDGLSSTKVMELSNPFSQTYNDFSLPQLAADNPFECYKWKRLDQKVIDLFGDDKTILIGCYKGKNYLDWIHTHQIYNIRLGKTKGSMDENKRLFERATILLLYEFGNPNKLYVYKIVGHQQMRKDELLAMGYPNKRARKNYMTFNIVPLEMDLKALCDHHLIEQVVKINPENIKGTPVFIEP